MLKPSVRGQFFVKACELEQRSGYFVFFNPLYTIFVYVDLHMENRVKDLIYVS